MKKCFMLTVTFLIFFAIGYTEEECHVFFIQLGEFNSANDEKISLDNEKESIVEQLAGKLAEKNFAAIYCSENPLAVHTAQILASSHDCPVIINPVLGNFARMKLFKIVGPLRTFGQEVYQNNSGRNIACIVPESMMNFIGRYIHGGFTNLPDFTYIQVNSDGTGLYL